MCFFQENMKNIVNTYYGDVGQDFARWMGAAYIWEYITNLRCSLK